MDDARSREFETAAKQQCDRNTFIELWLFLRDNKKWWLLPILVILVLFGVLMLLAGTGAKPFIYTLF